MITTTKALEKWFKRCMKQKRVAVDTESDSFHHYQEQVCLIQMTAGNEDVLIDPFEDIDLQVLAPFFAAKEPVKIFHDAVYDLVCLRRDFGFHCGAIFDTMLATRILGWKSFGLAAVLSERFGFEPDKRLQRSDWAQRPLTDRQIDYARFDTHFLPALMDQLQDELRECDRDAWAIEDFDRVIRTADAIPLPPRRADPDGFWRIKGIAGLKPKELGRLKELYVTRDNLAERLDRPPFKVLSDKVLVELAQDPPRSRADLHPRPGLRRGGIERFGDDIIKALRKAKPVQGKAPKHIKRRRRYGRLLDPDARDRYDRLRDVRRKAASALEIEPEVLLGNASLEEFARNPPSSTEEVAKHDDVQGWRASILAQRLYHALSK